MAAAGTAAAATAAEEETEAEGKVAERAKGTAVAMAAQAVATAGPATEAAAVMEGVAAKVAAQARTSWPPFRFMSDTKKKERVVLQARTAAALPPLCQCARGSERLPVRSRRKVARLR